MQPFTRVDLFCTVIDNFGDAGVCWRLAKRFEAMQARIRFIVRGVQTLQKLVPTLQSHDWQSGPANVGAIEVWAWEAFEAKLKATPEAFEVGELVVETFGCVLPLAYEERLELAWQTRACPPFYINLDYLSAESWVESCHKVWGLHPRFSFKKLWYFPGFTDQTGGVMIEDDYERQRNAFQAHRTAWLTRYGADPTATTVFVFSYVSYPLQTLLDGLLQFAQHQRLNILLANDATGATLQTLWQQRLKACDRATQTWLQTQARVITLPFIEQAHFDEILWACDTAFIRGEDSFVRAQLAQKPFVWSVYPIEDGGHEIKLQAWLQRLKSYAENNKEFSNYEMLATHWLHKAVTANDIANYLANFQALTPVFQAWGQRLLARGDLARHIAEEFHAWQAQAHDRAAP